MEPLNAGAQITPISLANEAMMLSNRGSIPVLIVEGPTDKAVLTDYLLRPDRCLPAYGFTNVIGALDRVLSSGGRYACGLVDADRIDEIPAHLFGFVENSGLPDCDTVVLTTTEVVTRVLSVLSDGRLHGPSALACLDRALELATPLGRIARESRLRRWGLSLSRFPVHEIAASGSGVDLDRLVDIAIKRSTAPAVDRATVLSVLSSVPPAATRNPALCRGHHLSSALVVAAVESGERLSLSSETLETHARIAFGPELFAASPLAEAIVRLENSTGHRLLREGAVK